ncbi:glycoside hydrolase family 3 protein [Pseudomonas graminis]|uniref:glycoside hydrolase family 3 protein n=1 Tax=Pseudomonas graminis TaxID=158627 RepID=UPI003C2336E5
MVGLVAAGTSAHFAVAAPVQPVLGSMIKPLLTIDGLQFRDLNGNGRLDPYEDWRLSVDARAKDLVARMSVEEKAGMMMHAVNFGYFGPGGSVLEVLAPPPPGSLKSPVNVTGVPGFDRSDKPSPATLINTYHVRWINSSPGGTPRDAATWANNIQKMAEAQPLGIPVILSADPVQTTNRLPGGSLPPPDRVKITSNWPDQIGLAAIGSTDVVEKFGRIAAAEYRALGFRMVINPIADISSEPRWNRIPGTFGENRKQTSRLVSAYVTGFQGTKLNSDSVLAVVKHFPGDGPVKDGLDPHQSYGSHLIYPGGRLEDHIEPFKAAIKSGTGAIMTTYGIPTALDNVGAAFSKKVVTGLLRDKLGYRGIVLSDWLHAMPWGVESLTKEQRELRMVQAGIDQFGGEHDPRMLIDLVRTGQVTPQRLDQSVERLLKPMFAIGQFEQPYVDPENAARVVKSASFEAAALDAQRRSIVLLKNEPKVIPTFDKKLWLVGFSAIPEGFAGRVASREEDADVIVVKVNAPYVVNNTGNSFFKGTHEGTLDYAGADNRDELDQILAAAKTEKPVVVAMSLERPAVLGSFLGQVSGMLATFGSGDQALLQIVTGASKASGHLPFSLPASSHDVEVQRADVADDFPNTQFHMGFGITN